MVPINTFLEINQKGETAPLPLENKAHAKIKKVALLAFAALCYLGAVGLLGLGLLGRAHPLMMVIAAPLGVLANRLMALRSKIF